MPEVSAASHGDGLLQTHDLMEQAGIRYWLDSGALLGLIRDGGEIPWDSDIDLGLWGEDVPKFKAWASRLGARGYYISSRKYRGVEYGFTITDVTKAVLRPIHVHVYYLRSELGLAWSPQVVAYEPKDRPRVDQGFAPWPQTRRVLCYLRGVAKSRGEGHALQRLWRCAVCLPLWGVFVVTRNRFDRGHWGRLWPYSVVHAVYTWLVPARHFLRLEHVEIGNRRIPVPSEVGHYLQARYGEWQKPVRDWCYWTDDGCILPASPETALEQAGKGRPTLPDDI